MNKAIKYAWINALRSKVFKQGKIRLRNIHNQYCCLGVLCEVIGLTWIQLHPDKYSLEKYPTANCLLPVQIRELVGIDGETVITLMEMNDRTNKSFDYIANFIENNL